MNWIFWLSAILIILSSCQKDNDENQELLLICFNEFYLNSGINAVDTLNVFEQELIKEGHLKSKDGNSYLLLLTFLRDSIYFKPLLTKKSFDNNMLYTNPTNLMECVQENYGVDTSEISDMPYYHCTNEIKKMILVEETIPIQSIFGLYVEHLNQAELTKPFVRISLLHLLYKWYYASKYNRIYSLQ
jgi:hypothetical protein